VKSSEITGAALILPITALPIAGVAECGPIARSGHRRHGAKITKCIPILAKLRRSNALKSNYFQAHPKLTLYEALGALPLKKKYRLFSLFPRDTSLLTWIR
jgi:hypothetical protein